MTQTAFHPGEHIQEELDALGMPAAMLAARLGVSLEQLTAVLGGHGSVVKILLEHGAEIERLPTLQAA